MAKFIFTLQVLLEQRMHAERRKQLAVAALERQRLDLETDIAACQEEIRSHKSDLRGLLGGGSGAAPVELRTVRLQAGASLHARIRTQRLALKLAGLYKRLDGARTELREAAMRCKAVELLRQRRYDEWNLDRQRRENSELDEMATMRAGKWREWAPMI